MTPSRPSSALSVVFLVAATAALPACSSTTEQQMRYSSASVPQQPPAAAAPRYAPPPAPTYPPGATAAPRATAPSYVAPPPASPPAGAGTAHAAPYAPPPPPPPTYPQGPSVAAPAPSAPSGGFVWATTLAEAQRIARQTGRMVFIEAGRDRCKNCMELKNNIIPPLSGELGQCAVGYYDDVDRDPNSQAFWALRNNLPSAGSLPLVGFFTPDLRWVHGFSGHTDNSKFRSDIDRARTLSRSVGAGPADRSAPRAETARAELPSGSLPDAELADVGDELIADLYADPVAAPTHRLQDVASTLEPEAPAATTARLSLARAASALAVRDFAAARQYLARVLDAGRDTPETREAAKGEVAIWNLRRIERDPGSAEDLRRRAQRDLRDTVWAPLFA